MLCALLSSDCRQLRICRWLHSTTRQAIDTSEPHAVTTRGLKLHVNAECTVSNAGVASWQDEHYHFHCLSLFALHETKQAQSSVCIKLLKQAIC